MLSIDEECGDDDGDEYHHCSSHSAALQHRIFRLSVVENFEVGESLSDVGKIFRLSGVRRPSKSELAARCIHRKCKCCNNKTTATTHDAPTTLISLILIINALSHFGQCQSEPSSNNDTEVIESRSPLFAIDPRLRVSHGNSRGSPRRM